MAQRKNLGSENPYLEILRMTIRGCVSHKPEVEQATVEQLATLALMFHSMLEIMAKSSQSCEALTYVDLMRIVTDILLTEFQIKEEHFFNMIAAFRIRIEREKESAFEREKESAWSPRLYPTLPQNDISPIKRDLSSAKTSPTKKSESSSQPGGGVQPRI